MSNAPTITLQFTVIVSFSVSLNWQLVHRVAKLVKGQYLSGAPLTIESYRRAIKKQNKNKKIIRDIVTNVLRPKCAEARAGRDDNKHTSNKFGLKVGVLLR